MKASYYSSIASARSYAAAAERDFMRRGLTARRSVKSPPRQLEYFSPRQLRKDRPRRPALEFRQEEEAAASQANLAKSNAYHLHKTPPTYFTEVVAEEALIAERDKHDKLIAEEEARLAAVELKEATEAACQALAVLLIEYALLPPRASRLEEPSESPCLRARPSAYDTVRRAVSRVCALCSISLSFVPQISCG